jgi:hypothetical protein
MRMRNLAEHRLGCLSCALLHDLQDIDDGAFGALLPHADNDSGYSRRVY